MICPACNRYIHYIDGKNVFDGIAPGSPKVVKLYRRFIYPVSHGRTPAPSAVPDPLSTDYTEACAVLPISSKASAALARRCMQGVLREQGYPQHNLVHQIDAALAETNPKKSLPSGLHNTIDAIRNFGNFSAHPLTDVTTGQVIDVEDGEAEWCLDILVELFDHYYVKPAEAARRKADLDAKLKKAGKPPSK